MWSRIGDSDSLVALEILDAGGGVEHDNLLVEFDHAGIDEETQRGETGGAFRSDEEAFCAAYFARDPDHFVIVDCNRATTRFPKNSEHEENADCFWHAQARGAGLSIGKFDGVVGARFERTNNRRAT